MYFEHLLAFQVLSTVSMVYAVNHRDRRLAGGQEAEVFEFPFMVVIYHKIMSCSGAIISDEWVLTAAHCFAVSLLGIKASEVKVMAGLVNYAIKKENDYSQIRQGIEVYTHPNYKVSENIANKYAK